MLHMPSFVARSQPLSSFTKSTLAAQYPPTRNWGVHVLPPSTVWITVVEQSLVPKPPVANQPWRGSPKCTLPEPPGAVRTTRHVRPLSTVRTSRETGCCEGRVRQRPFPSTAQPSALLAKSRDVGCQQRGNLPCQAQLCPPSSVAAITPPARSSRSGTISRGKSDRPAPASIDELHLSCFKSNWIPRPCVAAICCVERVVLVGSECRHPAVSAVGKGD